MLTVRDLINENIFHLINEGNLEKKIEKVFCCDLLSVAMGKIPENAAWVTIMGNMNTIALASLAEVSCIILAEGIELDDNSLKKAREEEIGIFYTKWPIFEAALSVHQLRTNFQL